MIFACSCALHRVDRWIRDFPVASASLGAFLLGVATILQMDRAPMPAPDWYSPSFHRSCLLLLIWTALTESDPVRRIVWVLIDVLILLWPWLLMRMLALPIDVSTWLYLLPWLGRAFAGAMLGAALVQSFYSLNLSHHFRRP